MKTCILMTLILLSPLCSADYSALTENEKAQWEHMSQGSNFYPFVWFKALNSVYFPDNERRPVLPVYTNAEELEKRYGFKKSEYQEVEISGKKRKYIIPFKGLTVSWANQSPKESDAYLDETAITRDIAGKKSAKFVGVNCALCHQSDFSAGNANVTIPGAPSQVDVSGYFTDVLSSTVAMFMKPELMTGFLQRVKLQNPELTHINPTEDAARIHLEFKQSVGANGPRNPISLKKGFISLYILTHNLKSSDDIGEVEDFAEWFSKKGVGNEPHVKMTPYYFGRSDALGSLGNAEIRGTEAVDLNAPVSFPWVWGTKYMTFAHHSANMNSPVQRNIGAALAVGGTFSSAKQRTSINLASVDYLEKLMHRIAPPQWGKVFHPVQHLNEYKINTSLLSEGRQLYVQQCMTCHESNRFVGPLKNLRDYKIFSLEKMGTDQNAAINVVRPVAGIPFGIKGAELTSGVAQLYFDQNKISAAEQRRINDTDLRGNSFMRDTFLGFNEQNTLGLDYGNIATGGGYKARHLAGAWATAPFLHNNSVPTLKDLLSPPTERPATFIVQGKSSFDPINVGLVTERFSKCPEPAVLGLFLKCLDTTISGNSNRGHEYGVELSAEQKNSLIEYLKILPPEPEYNF